MVRQLSDVALHTGNKCAIPSQCGYLYSPYRRPVLRSEQQSVRWHMNPRMRNEWRPPQEGADVRAAWDGYAHMFSPSGRFFIHYDALTAGGEIADSIASSP